MKTKLQSPFPRKVYERNSQIYKLLANPIRLEILNSIKHREATVSELVEMLGIRKANVSQHLSVLRYLKIVRSRREGKNVYYSITDPRIVEPCRIFKELWGNKVL